MKITGLIIVAVLLAIPLLWVPSLFHHSVVAVFSQLLGIWALIAMAVGQILATRFQWVESIFGGLDQVYVLHKWLGIGALHYLLISKPFSNLDPLGLYVGVMCIIGVLAFLWRSLPVGLRPGHRYQISELETFSSATAVKLKPVKRGLKHRAGQFVNIAVEGEESHPFTVSLAPQDDRNLRVSIGALGDHTNQLRNTLTIGQTVRVEGPHGRFYPSRRATSVWVAGGIGITPFLAWAGAMKSDDPAATLVYCVKDRPSASHLDELEQLATSLDNLTLILWESRTQGRLTSDQLVSLCPNIVSGAVAFCGPVPMRKSLQADLSKAGLPARQFHYEDFEFRTGIGLEALSAWVWSRMMEARELRQTRNS